MIFIIQVYENAEISGVHAAICLDVIFTMFYCQGGTFEKLSISLLAEKNSDNHGSN